MRNFNLRSITLDYTIIVMLIIAAVIITSVGIFSYKLFVFKNQDIQYIKENTHRIESIIKDSFDYVDQIAKLTGNQIVDHSNNELEKISNIINSNIFSDEVAQTLFSWSMFGWVNKKNQLVVSGHLGVLSDPQDISYRKYTKVVRLKPWKLIFDEPDYGLKSGKLIVPAALGITDKKNNFIGFISMGFDINRLINRIESKIADTYYKFIVVHEDTLKPYFHTKILDLPNDFKNQIAQIPFQDEGVINQEIKVGQINLVYYKRIPGYPFIVIVGADQSLSYYISDSEVITTIVPIILIGTISLLILLWMRNILYRPVLLLSDIAQKINFGDNVFVPKFNTKELNELAKQLVEFQRLRNLTKRKNKELAGAKQKLENYSKKLETLNHDLEDKVKERTHDLEKALEIKNKFLNNVSHEIRTPVQSFSNLSETLKEKWSIFDEEKKVKLVREVASNAKRLSTYIGNLLDLSKHYSGHFIFNKNPVSFKEIVEDMILECKELYLHNKNIEIEYNYLATNDYISADKEAIKQVLRNLFINAIKYCNNTNKIWVQVSDYHRDQIIFSIIDQGIGIPEYEIDKIFDAFYQSSKTRDKSGGTGLGLSISKEIIEGHEGKIWAENNIDLGAKFSFVIPKVKIEDSSKKRDINSILMIDDEDACLTSVEMILYGTGYNLKTVNNARDAFDYLERNHNEIDLILLDLMMPDIYGLELLEILKKNDNYKNIPVILQTGANSPSEISRAYELGIFNCIRKPYDKKDLLNVIKNLNDSL